MTVADCKAMRIIAAGFLLSLLSLSAAEYFSSGWKPGQTASATINPGATFDPSKPTPGHESKPTAGALVSLLTGGPIGALLNRAGINVTQKLEEARIKEDNRWDKRIPLLTDFNYKDIVVQEKLTPDEEFKRIWFIIMFVMHTVSPLSTLLICLFVAQSRQGRMEGYLKCSIRSSTKLMISP